MKSASLVSCERPPTKILRDDSADANSHTFNELVEEQTPGGLNEQIVREMTEAGAYVALHDSLDGAIARINGTPRANKRKRPYTSEAE